MALYYGKHKVRNYDEWRPFFDKDNAHREEMGVKVVSVMQSSDDSNDVHFVFDVSDVDKFMEMLKNPEMRDIMKEAGVEEQPTLYRLENVMG